MMACSPIRMTPIIVSFPFRPMELFLPRISMTIKADACARRHRLPKRHSFTTIGISSMNVRLQRLSRTKHTYWGKDISGSLQGAGGVGGLLYLKRNGTIYIPHYDANGNIVRYTDTAGNVVAEYTYGAFGNKLSANGSLADVFRFWFSTKYCDPETDLYYYGYRFYSPSLMRWLNHDPIEEEGGINLYEFCLNNSLYSIDSFGCDRYMTTFSMDPRKNQWHVGVAVDTWKCKNGKWQKTGVVTFEFLVDDSSWWKRAGRFVAVAKGVISDSNGLNLVEPCTLSSTPEQDMAMLNQMRNDQKNPPLYNVFFNNCIHWATIAIDYGMDK